MSSSAERAEELSQRRESLSERRAGLSAGQQALLAKWSRRKTADAAAASRLPRRPAGAPAELSFAQQRLWFLDQMEPGSALYNIPLAVSLEGRLRSTALERSLNEIVRRHETLRTTFSAVDGRPHQVIAASFELPLPRIDLRALPAAERRFETERLAREEARRSFDLERGPVVRTRLLLLGAARHALLLTLHHICSDFWSMGIFIRELGELYRSFSTGGVSPLAELPVQYADFACWQRRYLSGEILQEQLDYWRRALAGAPTSLALATDRRRAPRASFRGASRSFTVPEELATRVESLAQRRDATLFMTLLAACVILLHRYTGQRDLVVGTPIANRNRSEIEGLIGFFVNTLVLRADLSPAAGRELTFLELLERVRQVAVGAYAHQDLPFEQLLEELRPERNRSQTPLFQVAFAFESTPVDVAPGELDLAGLRLRPLETDSGTAKFDLSILLQRGTRGLAGSIEYAADLFDATTVVRLGEHYRRLLGSVAARPKAGISALEMLGPAERWQVLGEWNATAVPAPRPLAAHRLFEAQAARTPDALALACGERRLTYREVDERADRLARRLRRLGVEPERPVAVLLERSPETVVASLAVWKAGGAYVPMDPGHPEARRRFVLRDLRPAEGPEPVLLTVARLAAPTLGAESRESSGDGGGGADLAYLIYTSGSTGEPKGVEIEHAALSNLVAWHRRTYRISPTDRATLLASPAFDASVWEMWPYLTTGASLHVVEPQVLAAATELVEWLAARRITHAFLPTPLAEAALPERWPSDAALRVLLTGGDKLHRGAPRRAPFRLANHYGPTENAVVTTWTPVAAEGEDEAAPPIGRPLANIRVHLLGPTLEPVPMGAAGELAAGGASLARGYRERRGLTADKFIPDPFGRTPGDRLYKTGDLARYRTDGHLEFLGRIDAQVKVRGFRIELGEIETQLGRHPAVAEAAVVARGEGDDKRLLAYMVASGELSTRDVRDHLRERLPEYMVPSSFVTLAALPLNASGKVDRRALPEPEAGRGDLEAEFVAPRNSVEEALAGIWAEALGREEIGVDDDFFELGGHSLLATQLISRIRKAFRMELPVASLFDATTVAAMARLLEENEPRSGHTEKVARVLNQVRGMSAEDLREALGRKRRQVDVDV